MQGVRLDGARLKRIRCRRGLTQKDVATLSGVSERTVRNAECGKKIRYEFLGFLAVALGVEPIDLIDNEKELRTALVLSPVDRQRLTGDPPKPIELVDEISRTRLMLLPAKYFDQFKLVLILVVLLGNALDADDVCANQPAELVAEDSDDADSSSRTPASSISLARRLAWRCKLARTSLSPAIAPGLPNAQRPLSENFLSIWRKQPAEIPLAA